MSETVQESPAVAEGSNAPANTDAPAGFAAEPTAQSESICALLT